MTHIAFAPSSLRLLLLGAALGAALHGAWPLLEQWFWCRSELARLYECLLVLFEAREPRWASHAVAAIALTAWAALAWRARARCDG